MREKKLVSGELTTAALVALLEFKPLVPAGQALAQGNGRKAKV
jgi:hypothetical protein